MSTQSFLPNALHKGVKANDEKALQQLYTSNYHPVERFVLQNSGSSEEAKDIFQEAFIAVWRNIQFDKFSPTNDNSIHAYLFQIAKNKWLDHLRSSKVKKTTTLDNNHENTMTFEEWNDKDTERLQDIKEKFKKLGDNCQDLLTRFYYKKQSLRQIADALGWTEPTAKNNKYRCMESLRSMLKK